MAKSTQFGHDEIGHLLSDNLLEVPVFQRRYSWDRGNVEEYLSDLERARSGNVDYFMGTVVFASADQGSMRNRKHIVDGQQRLLTTALLLIAIRDQLRENQRERQAEELEKKFLRGYEISLDETVERLIPAPDDLDSYRSLLDGTPRLESDYDKLYSAHDTCIEYLREQLELHSIDILVEIAEQLDKSVQVLVAEATDLPEAYVIFETLNDRGADLTTADLLKNYVFSSAGQYFRSVERNWTSIESGFDKPEELVKFMRYEHVSRTGPTSGRRLYRELQAEIANSPQKAKAYVDRLSKASAVYHAIKSPESDFWSDTECPVRDALYGYRRLGFEASLPVLLAAFSSWEKEKAARLMVKVIGWMVRAQFAGNLGGGVPDKIFADTAFSISSGRSINQIDVRQALDRIIPGDEELKKSFANYGETTTSRAKYILAMLEQAHLQKAGKPDSIIEWWGRSVTVEHIAPKSSGEHGDAKTWLIGNFALLEKRFNHSLGSKSYKEKKEIYRDSSFYLTSELGSSSLRSWTARHVATRNQKLAELATLAWPNS